MRNYYNRYIGSYLDEKLLDLRGDMTMNFSSLDVAALLEQGNQRLRQHLVKIKNENKRVAIFGAGDAGQIVYDTLRSFGIEVAFFIDNDRQKWGCDYSGCEVRSPPPRVLSPRIESW